MLAALSQLSSEQQQRISHIAMQQRISPRGPGGHLVLEQQTPSASHTNSHQSPAPETPATPAPSTIRNRRNGHLPSSHQSDDAAVHVVQSDASAPREPEPQPQP